MPSETFILKTCPNSQSKSGDCQGVELLETQEYQVKDKILATPSETSKEGKCETRRVRRWLDHSIWRMRNRYGAQFPLVGSEMDEAHASRYLALEDIMRACDIDFESNSIGPGIVQETTDKVVSIKEKFKVVRDGQKSYAGNRRKPLEFEVDKTLRLVEEPIEIMDRAIKCLKRSKVSLVKVRWNSKRGPEFTWEREDYMKSKYPQLFVDRANESAS
ncbi:hypothetical protein Tco_1525582 [Tanacetum coccineum]